MITSTTTTRPTTQARLAAAKTAYLAIPRALATGRESEYLAQVRRAFPHLRIGIYDDEFENSSDWWHNLRGFIADVDVLIVGCDSTRLIGSGVRREIDH